MKINAGIFHRMLGRPFFSSTSCVSRNLQPNLLAARGRNSTRQTEALVGQAQIDFNFQITLHEVTQRAGALRRLTELSGVQTVTKQYNWRGEHVAYQVDGTTIPCADGNTEDRAIMVSAALEAIACKFKAITSRGFVPMGLKQRTDWTQYYQFNTTPKTIAKWVKRFGAEGLEGLRDRSSRPLHRRAKPRSPHVLLSRPYAASATPASRSQPRSRCHRPP